VHKTVIGLGALGMVMGFIGYYNELPLDSAWFGLTKLVVFTSGVLVLVLLVLMGIQAYKK